MKAWLITYIDRTGVESTLTAEFDRQPTLEDAAHLLRSRRLPIVDKLDLNDFDGRVVDPTVKELKEHNSIEILSITPAPQ